MRRAYNRKRNRGALRPILLTLLGVFSLVFSLSFIISSTASSEKFFRGFPVLKAPEKAPVERMLSLEYSEYQPDVERTDFVLGPDDSFYKVMTSAGVHPADVQRIVRKTRPLYDLRRLKRGTVLKVTSVDGEWKRVEYKVGDFEVLTIENGMGEDEGVKVAMVDLPYEVREVLVSGTINSSLYEAGTRAGADPTVLMQLSDIFAWDIDFASDIRKGDSFKVMYELVYVEGRAIRTGRILGAEMENDGRHYTAYYYDGGENLSGYYDSDGKSLKRTLLKSPLRYRRISSYFSKRRYHPILKRYRPHHGVDYAAPVGTPVEAAGSGTVVYAGWNGGYGNYVKIKHNNTNYYTAYGHLSSISRGVKKWARVKQGDVIGRVGNTGRSTGPHLHYEVYQGKRLVNPLSLKPAPVGRIPDKALASFTDARDEISSKLAAADSAYASAKIEFGGPWGPEGRMVASVAD